MPTRFTHARVTYAVRRLIMKRNSIYKKALVLLAVLALTLVLLVGCGQTKKVDNLNQFVKPDNGNNGEIGRAHV